MYTGRELKIRRVIMDMQAKDIAEMIGIHKSYISKMEKEVQRIPDYIYERWIEILGMNKE